MSKKGMILNKAAYAKALEAAQKGSTLVLAFPSPISRGEIVAHRRFREVQSYSNAPGTWYSTRNVPRPGDAWPGYASKIICRGGAECFVGVVESIGVTSTLPPEAILARGEASAYWIIKVKDLALSEQELQLELDIDGEDLKKLEELEMLLRKRTEPLRNNIRRNRTLLHIIRRTA